MRIFSTAGQILLENKLKLEGAQRNAPVHKINNYNIEQNSCDVFIGKQEGVTAMPF